MKTRDDIQAEVAIALDGKKNAAVEGSMGVGKCVMGLQHMAKLYHDTAKFLVVVPRKTIIDSWTKDAYDFDLYHLLPHITFTTYLSLKKQPHDFDAIYLDECHSLTFKHGDWLSIYQIKHEGTIIGFTGTYPTYMKGEKGQMCHRFCPKVYEYGTDHAVLDGILNDYKIIIHKLHLTTAKTMEKKRKDGKTWMASELGDYEYWTKRVNDSRSPKDRQISTIQRMKAIQAYPTKEKYAKKLFAEMTTKTILFANTQEQADKLCTHSVHSKNTMSDRNLALLKSGEILKLSAVEQLSEGVTVPGLETIIIMHSYGNNKKAAQKIGRTLRLSPDKVATIHILCYENSIDKKWVTDALKAFDTSKISWLNPR
jgi:superfamily II DNA or RNA helicase